MDAVSRAIYARKIGRGDRIRTCDPLVPNQVLYQAEPLPDREGGGDLPRSAPPVNPACRPKPDRAFWPHVTLLALSRYVSFHGRGEAAFAWHGLTGDVAQMSRDVLGLLLAFDPAAEEETVAKSPPEGLSRHQVLEFTTTLRARRFLVLTGSQGHKVDEMSPLLAGIPRVPRATVFERTAQGVVLY